MKQLLVLRRSLASVRFSSYSTSSNTTSSQEKTSSSKPTEDVDITIAGGGLVGSAMALAFAASPVFKNHKVVLLESQSKLPKVSNNQPYSNRVCAVNAQGIRLFEKLGAWELMKSIRVQKVARMQVGVSALSKKNVILSLALCFGCFSVWDACTESLITFDPQQPSDEGLAYIIENDVIQSCLLERLRQLGVQPRLNSKVKHFEHDANAIRIKLEDENSSLRTKLLIAADGHQSSIRAMAQIPTMQWNYDQFGLVATLKLAENMSANVAAWQRFLPTGPIACLPLSNTHSSLVWTVPKTMLQTLMTLSDEQFADAINRAFTTDAYKSTTIVSFAERIRSYWQQIIPASPSALQYPPVIAGVEPKSRAAFPLSLLNANQYVRARLALIGDAAHRIHPMAGQGVNMGFGDVVCLLDILEKAVQNGADFSSLTYLVDYERQRQLLCLARLLSVDSLNRIYATDFSPIVALRSLGLSFVNECSPIKNFFAKQATQHS